MKENLFDIVLDKDQRYRINIDEFWRQVFQLPVRPTTKHSHSKVLYLRYHKDGSIKLTYKEIAKELGINTPGGVKALHDKALRYMRYPGRSNLYAPRPPSKEAPVPKKMVIPLRLGLY